MAADPDPGDFPRAARAEVKAVLPKVPASEQQDAQPAEPPVDQRKRDRQNLAAFVVIAALVLGGVYLMDLMQKAYQMEICIERGRHDCGRLLDR